MSALRYTAEHARALDYCTFCPRLCHFACPSALGESSETASAWGLMTLANLDRKGEISLHDGGSDHLWECASCGRCTDFCKHGNPVVDVIAIARAMQVARDVIPAAIREMKARFVSDGAPNPFPAALKRDRAPEPAAIGLLLSCAHLESFDRARVDALVALLRAIAGREVALVNSQTAACCGGVARRAGLVTEADRARDAMIAETARYELVLTDCSDAGGELRGRDSGPDVVPLVRYLADRADQVAGLADGNAGSITLHGGCRERRNWSLRDDECAVLGALGFEVTDAFAIHGSQECCGGDAVYAAVSPRGAAVAGKAVVDGARTHGGALATSAARCSRHMTTASGETVRSVLDLVLERCSTPS